ncbi:hypothetical protein [Kamptonema sp. UHCC 0994]|uniref:hypothetical protein n=1 Tax=Kamptonema sp. UHCC 0994 TaxID=3031329 RepID=UPI0023B9B596|nr:hypothetical protein [Kamptonema sp. UHCC 0994]MDF0554058.1 hypothetical protein [Kamptonema sp. UHCC 0994]
MNQLIYPTLDLFLYDLRDGLGETEAQINQNRANFRKKLPFSEKFINSDGLESDDLLEAIAQYDPPIEVEYAELLKSIQDNKNLDIKNKKIWFEKQQGEYSLKGRYYPVRMGDTYGLQLDCSVEATGDNAKSKGKAYSPSCFAYLKAEIDRRRKGERATLGETWLISGQINSAFSNPEAMARDCYKYFNSSGNWKQDYQGQGKLLGGTLFELWGYDAFQTTPTAGLQGKSHVIIALYPDESSARVASRFNFDWIRLLNYRSKIIWAYNQSRDLKQNIKDDFSTVSDCVGELESNSYQNFDLKRLRKTLDKAQHTLAHYTVLLNQIETQLRTIETNLSNYQKRLIRMEEKTQGQAISLMMPELIRSLIVPANQNLSENDLLHSLLPIAESQRPSNLKFLEKFSLMVEQKYMLQVEKDYTSLNPGLRLLESLINSIRGAIEIDQAKRDRRFQTFVEVLGVGAATASLTATAVAPLIQQITTPTSGGTNEASPLKYDPGLTWSFFFMACVGVGILASGFAYFLHWLRSRD